MSTVSENNKRIAKNTLFLYFRMLLTMVVSLFTVRVVLDTLGVTDYGIYNVVGGVVVMFSFISNTMASASQRFFAFELGRKNYVQLKKTFATTTTIYVIIAIIILILTETVGLWFLNTKMTIPVERMSAANWVYQFAIVSFIVTILAIPYNSAIIAHERMNVYAYVSIADVVFKLLIVYLLVMFSYDKLKLYAALTLGVTTIISLLYQTYCKQKFEECRFSICWNKPLFKEIVSYSGWNMIGTLAYIIRSQGINILLNIFFNPSVNAARAIAYQVNSALSSFSNNFYTAVRPQIIKSYSSTNIKEMHSLIYSSSKFAFYLMMILAMPLLIETKYILSLWLKEIPDYADIFTKLVIVNSLVDIFNIPLTSSIQATGKVRTFHLTVSMIVLLILPISYIFLKLGYPPETTMIVSIFAALTCFLPRLYLAKKFVGISIKTFLQNVLLSTLYVFVLSLIIPLIIYLSMPISMYRFVLVVFTCLLSSGIIVYTLGTDSREKNVIKLYTKRIYEKFINK